MAMDSSDVAEFYANRSVLITGASGFIGKALIEKFLRSVPRLRHVYALIRPLKGQTAEERWRKISEGDVFDLVRQKSSDGSTLLDKVVVVHSDMMKPDLGISREDEERICENVSVVFHCAATVRFDEPLRTAVTMNVRSTQLMARLSDKMKRLAAFVHVSTAFCNCDYTYVMERVYPSPVPPGRFIEAMEWMSDDMLDALTPAVLGRKPNTYTLTKSMAETLLKQEAAHLPVTIVRPSIVTSTWREPKPGWLDNYNGAVGISALLMKGLIRVLYGRLHEVTADIIPVDIVVNTLIVAGWHRAVGKGAPIDVMHVSSDRLNLITWGEVVRWSRDYMLNHAPLSQLYREAGGKITIIRLEYRLRLIFDHLVPAYLIDGIIRLIGKRPFMIRLYAKIFKVLNAFEYFHSNNWEHQTRWTPILSEQLSEEDRRRFCIDVREVDWKSHTNDSVIAVRKYILKEDISTVPEGFRVQYRRRLLYKAFRLGMWAFIIRFFVKNTQIGAAIWMFIQYFFYTTLKKLSGGNKKSY